MVTPENLMAQARRLPPLNSLRAFEAAARHGSFTGAARELGVTQSAVSRHVLQLEARIGTALCTRMRRGIELTAEGAAYAATLRAVFDQIEQHTRRLTSKPASNTLRLKLPPTFAIRWLVPRLARFHAIHRHIDVQITTSHQPVEFDREDIDVCIHWGEEPPRGTRYRRLFGEILLPVCSPALFNCYPRPRRPADLAHYTLLCSLHRPEDWPTWLGKADVSEIDGNEGLKFENSALAYQAAIDELGIVVAQRAFVEDDLRTGRLVAIFDLCAATGSAYFLAYPEQKRPSAKVRAFETWIVGETSGLEMAMPQQSGAQLAR
jgi:LysR family transcriptional regulator, glycine cleavage system transcriptional activator